MNDETKKRRGNIITITFLLAIVTILYVTILDHTKSSVWIQIIEGLVYFIIVFIAVRLQDKEINKLVEARQMEDAKKVL